MAFPLAHPAAVLPFRRACPRYLSFVALVIGSFTPDLANCLNWDVFTHSLLGSLVFCLPIGMVCLGVFLKVRTSLTTALPNPHRDALLPLCQSRPSPLHVYTLSLLLGSWLHVGWDMFTHDHDWLAQRLGTVAIAISGFGRFDLRTSRLIYALSTAAGLLWLFTAYRSFLREARRSASSIALDGWRQYSLWALVTVGVLIVSLVLGSMVSRDYSGITYFLRAVAEFYLALGFLALGFIGFWLRSGTGSDRPH
jgi:hypothetical protein